MPGVGRSSRSTPRAGAACTCAICSPATWRAAAQFAAEAPGVRYDYSRQRLGAMTLRLLAHLAAERGFSEWREALFAGSAINTTENRAAVAHGTARRRGRAARK